MTVTSAGNRCGVSWRDANNNCNEFCASDGECISANNTHRCFAGLNAACPVSLTRCGTDFTNANENCGPYCLSNDWCPEGQNCFTDLQDICDFRCGKNWGDANKDCKSECRTGNSNDCPTGEQCFGELTKVCSGSASTASTSSILLVVALVLVKKLL